MITLYIFNNPFMWIKLSGIIIKYRVILLVSTVLFSLVLSILGTRVGMTYDFVKVLPESHPDMKFYKNFLRTFQEDGNVLVLGIKDENLLELNNFNSLYDLSKRLEKINGIISVISIPNLPYPLKDEVQKKFTIRKVFDKKPENKQELDGLLKIVQDQKLYEHVLLNPEKNATILAVVLDKNVLNSAKREQMMETIDLEGEKFTADTGIKVRIAGLPYIRAVMMKEVKGEFLLFLLLSVVSTCLILYACFRSIYPVIFTFLIILILVSLSLGTLVLLDYKINLLTGILPAIIVIVSIPNCIYMYNKYHREMRNHGNKVKAISRIIQKIGYLILMTNANTAVGFLVLAFTDVTIIKQFGIVAGIMSICTFLVSLIVIPAMLFYLPLPGNKQLKHLDLTYLRRFNLLLEKIVEKRKPVVYGLTIFLLLLSFYGLSKIRTRTYMVDDLPEKSHVKSDLAFFEKHFTGVMPLEIIVDFKKDKALKNPLALKDLAMFEEAIKKEKYVSPPLSMAGIIKAARQAYFNGAPSEFSIPAKRDYIFLASYLENSTGSEGKYLVDSTGSVARISCRVTDVGNEELEKLISRIKSEGEEIFGDKAEVSVTGATVLFLKGNQYLINDLTSSLVLAFFLISLMMAMIFFNFRMILISLVPNIIPMILTAGIMGIFGIPLKPSTALIFSISFGISVDSTIHFLSKFKQELGLNKGNVQIAVLKSLDESGVSIIYTSLVLLGGFIIFCFSDFGGTVALGLLTSITLFFSMLTNLTLLPALIATFYKSGNKNDFKLSLKLFKHGSKTVKKAA